ncbi:MAG: PDZ domain-containing protein [Pirellula sp.]
MQFTCSPFGSDIRSRRTSKRWPANAALLVVATLVPMSYARQANGQVQMQFQVARLAGNMGANQPDLESEMRMEIDAMQRVLDLSQATVRKLKVASLAAIRSASKKNPPKQVPLPGLGGNTAVPPKEGTLSDEDAERKEKSSTNRAQQAQPPFFQMLGIEMVKQEEIWKKTVANSLSEDQIKQFESFQTARKVERRALAVQNKVGELDACLILTEQQKTRLTKLIDEKLGDALTSLPPIGFGGGGLGQVVIRMAGQGDKDLVADDLRDILSTDQLNEFERQKKLAANGPLGVLPPQVAKPPGLAGETLPMGFDVEDNAKGVVVTRVEENSDASRAGIQSGDVIDAVGKTPIDTTVQLKRALKTELAGAGGVIHVIRDGKKQEIKLTKASPQ